MLLNTKSPMFELETEMFDTLEFWVEFRSRLSNEKTNELNPDWVSKFTFETIQFEIKSDFTRFEIMIFESL